MLAIRGFLVPMVLQGKLVTVIADHHIRVLHLNAPQHTLPMS